MKKILENIKEVEPENSFVWVATRISFWTMIFSGILVGFLVPEVEELTLIDWVLCISIFPSFIFSIIHLCKYKEKGLAITSLVISSIFVLCFLLGMVLVLIGIV